MNADLLQFEVPESAAGRRMDSFLGEQAEGRSRSALRRLILDGRVRVDGLPVTKPSHPLKPGMRVVVELPPAPGPGPLPEPIPFELLREDEHLVVVIKPAGMVVHPGHGRSTGTLINALLGRGIPLAPVGAPDRPGIVHRLDKGTSGILVVAKTAEAHAGLARAFAERRVDKRYRALVWGRPDPPAGCIERAIGRSRAHPLKMAVSGTRGRTRLAETRFDTVETVPGFALLDLWPRTGRTHQIRVHMQSIHHPIVGDEQYGGRAWRGVQDPLKRKALRLFERLALHASDLSFAHPVTGETLSFHAPLPADFEELLRALRREP